MKLPQESSKRLSKLQYYLGIAKAVSERSTCLRCRYGAILVKNDKIISTGYNGSPRGEENCCDLGVCYRLQQNIPSGSNYELCKSVHAEVNAIIQCDQATEGAMLYIAGTPLPSCEAQKEPCLMCHRIIKNAGVKEVLVWNTETGELTYTYIGTQPEKPMDDSKPVPL